MKRRIDRGQAGHTSTWIAIVLLLIGSFFVLTYLPPWYKSWKAKDVIGEAISGSSSNAATEELFQQSITRALNEIGIDITEGDVSVQIDKESRDVDIVVTWKAEFNFLFSSRKTSMTFVIKVKRKLS